MESLLVLPIIISFFTTLFFVYIWIKKAKQIGLIWEDMHKINHPKNVAGSGGLGVLFGFTLGTLVYIAIKTFILKTDIITVEIFALLTTILVVGFVGFVDDLLGWRLGGLSKRSRIIMILFATIPLIVINAGESTMMGVNISLLYPLVLIPIGILGASTTFNFIAGYNGLETSQGIIILSALAFVTWLDGKTWLSLISLIMVSSLIAFYLFNKYPAKIFPGDVLTYCVGAMIAVIAILGNIEKITMFFFIPYIIETGLKLRGKLKKQSFAKLNEKGGLELPYDKFYGIEHIAVYILKKIKKNGEVREKEVVFLINGIQILVILIGLALFIKEIRL